MSGELLRILLSVIDLQKLSIYMYLQLVRKMVAIHSSKEWVCLCTVAAILFLISGGLCERVDRKKYVWALWTAFLAIHRNVGDLDLIGLFTSSMRL